MTLASPHGSYAADPGPAAREGESDFANSGKSLGISRLQALAAGRVPTTPRFGPAIDGYAPNDPQSTCNDPAAKPGPVALRALLNDTYDLNRTGGITRNCGAEGTSEHKEGRALDYMLNKNNDHERDIANTVVDWMLETDGYGNRHAIARRLGIMYIIWDRKIWSSARASEGWRNYVGSSPHTDHIHFSFSWPGARKQTTWWTSAIEPEPVFTQGSSRSYNTGKYDHDYERGANDTLVHYWYEDGWHRAILPGSIVSDPVAYYADDQDHVYGRTANGDLQHWWFVRGDGWKTANLGGDITGNPTAFHADGYHHVFARTTNGDLYHWWSKPGEGWKTANLGGDITDSPTAYAGSNLAQHAYARTTNGDLYHWWFLPGEGWKTANLGGDITNSPTGYHAGNGTDHVYARTTNGDLYHWWYTPGEGWTTANLGGDITGSPSSYHAMSSEQDHVYARTRNGNLYHWWHVNGDGWKTANLGGDL